ncbi:hypothetical protein [Salisediminibacterium beveridgei]|uniref:Uncharacterized protein n=1 Tax=Salisediminibacterium beveridgei TaxID=632773 RepID=A0A1D7QY59_9BACI|nr:hypothetical protein [Salisediminibacterium beveridgei]AOM83934.1 hypothetical protein BBEV_2595 [Salisediminibacterium beveridgei]
MQAAQYDFFRKQVIQSLPEPERGRIIAYETLENELVEAACDETELLQLMIDHRPFEQVAVRFGQSADDMYTMMQELEETIHEEVLLRAKACRFQDMTELMVLYRGEEAANRTKFYYLSFTNDRNHENDEERGASY